ncbi:putative O-methyltransferase [Pseudomonas sp. JV551A1]|uniref:O-methyltransferase n=1 Tax=Pseudomonas inefficax TaxID=2078786 RepID=A0AAQ1PC02_9PSED|nr:MULTISPECIES: TylF/MycF/NovP-related O-methyltransferase [Pseudomonas]SPO56698.1 putative O-methyltransferase [Pseudomonas sp. JV551A1]SPO62857.1 putative O-methyltransferase [Pseudomonas inefficax]
MKTVKSDHNRRLVMRHLRDTWIKPLDKDFPHSALISRATYSPWYADAAFMEVFERIQGLTLVDIYRCHELWDLLRQTAKVAGDVIEVGVWKGGTGLLAAKRLAQLESNKHLLLCDTFCGVVKAGANDTLYQGGEHADTSLEGVAALLEGEHLKDRVTLLQGIFPEQTGSEAEGRLFSFCHIDVDTYQSAKDIVEWVTPRLNRHGVIVFDDYGFWGCEGVARLVEDLADHPEYFLLRNLNGHAVMLKLTEASHV